MTPHQPVLNLIDLGNSYMVFITLTTKKIFFKTIISPATITENNYSTQHTKFYHQTVQ